MWNIFVVYVEIIHHQIDDFVQYCNNPITNTLELLQSTI